MNINKPDILFINSDNYNLTDIQKHLTINFSYKSNNSNSILIENYIDYFKKAFIKFFNLVEYKLSNKDVKYINFIMKK
jgi:hypothetical protein